MTKIISIHSFRGGTGKSTITANVAYLMASKGYLVGVIDTDIQSPGIHILFNIEGREIRTSLNDYLWHGRDIMDAAINIGQNLSVEISGQLYLIPSSMKPGQIARVLREGYNADRLIMGLRQLVESLNLDVLLIDTHPGLNEETLLSLVISQVLVVVMRPDKQDYEGTGITMEVARKLDVPRTLIVVNKAPAILEPADLKGNVEKLYRCEVATVIPHSEALMNLASEGIFAIQNPGHALTELYEYIAESLLS
jgi:MinD-like ATPase involved in chromosome partitioning or flagellar assembly